MFQATASDEIETGPMASWGSEGSVRTPDWRTVDRALRAIRQRRAALDAEEARWLREAEKLQIWRPLGMVSALDYMERVLGYAPRTAQDRLRVARALGDLPQLTAALAADDLAFSAVRELTRVATPGTEAAWIAAAAGKNLRQVEELVADHRPGDRPDDPPDPQARSHVVRFELAAATFALLRQARTVLDDEHGTNLSDDGFVATLCSAVLDGATSTETTGRAKYQIAVTVCQRCRQGWQEGAGAQVAIEPWRSTAPCATPSTLDRSTIASPSARIRTSPRVPRAWCGVAMGAAAACRAAGRREGSRSTTWSIAPTAEPMRLRTSACCARRVTSRTIAGR
ncbi:MAG TPA: hypothetical protein VHT91_14075 [Kofleriaceae bacterium]|nr:hypothetical protein [Kofleriaceae bacterium]